VYVHILPQTTFPEFWMKIDANIIYTVNPDGAVGQIGQAVGGPFSKDGLIGSQFDASKNGIAGHVERAVDGPSNPAGSSK
jgi:hypothetical protein